MFAKYVAPAILLVCALVFFWLAREFSRSGRPGKAIFDVIGGCSLLIVTYYLLSL